MTIQLAIRLCNISRSNLLRTAPLTSHIAGYQSRYQFNPNQIRLAGHAKWQNIASTKSKNDMAKGKKISRYVMLVKRAIITNGRQADPKLNGKLADVLAEASKMNVPKATLERAITRAMNVKVLSVNLEVQGPGGCAMILRCETESPSLLRRDIKKILKKYDSNLMPDDSLINMFHSRGFIRVAPKTTDGRDINQDFAEEAAILANVEEVSLEVNDETTDEELSKVWVFNTDANSLNTSKGELEKLGLKVLSHDLDLVPYRNVDFGRETYEKVVELTKMLEEHEQVIDIFHNIEVPQD